MECYACGKEIKDREDGQFYCDQICEDNYKNAQKQVIKKTEKLTIREMQQRLMQKAGRILDPNKNEKEVMDAFGVE